jgi:hypothetical protein
MMQLRTLNSELITSRMTLKFFDDYSRGKGQKLPKYLERASPFWPRKGEIKQIHIENPQQEPKDKNLVAQAIRRLGFVHSWKTWFPLRNVT